MTADSPHQVVLDAGPLIGFFDRRDRHHVDARRGLEQLISASATLATPLSITFEVHKWLLYHVGVSAARSALATMRESLDIVHPDPEELGHLEALLDSMPRWAGSLEDATVALIGLRTDTPVWTLNYRDLAAFPNLRFWTPA